MNKIIRVISVLYAILFIASQIIIYIMLNRAEITTQESLNLLNISAQMCNATFFVIAVGIIYLIYCIRRDYRLDVAIAIALQVVLGIFCVILSIPLGIILG
ncbi:hypothetical protein B5F86_13820 [Lachnoclostridium sp. An298]|nr:hypothetical protein B5F86_13820 [Lachnoclostridium sp. An298]